jgi:hypothetical protein
MAGGRGKLCWFSLQQTDIVMQWQASGAQTLICGPVLDSPVITQERPPPQERQPVPVAPGVNRALSAQSLEPHGDGRGTEGTDQLHPDKLPQSTNCHLTVHIATRPMVELGSQLGTTGLKLRC